MRSVAEREHWRGMQIREVLTSTGVDHRVFIDRTTQRCAGGLSPAAPYPGAQVALVDVEGGRHSR